MGVGKWGGKNECRRGQKEIRRDGATAGKADESRRVIFVEVRVFLKVELKQVREKEMFVEQTRKSQGSWS